jgi:two-component system, chemotaxis family, sensor kinase CheA
MSPRSRGSAMNELHEQFIAEARELVLEATDDLMAVERFGFDADRIDRIFRAFHTLKGSAGVVDLPAMGLVLHAAEDLLAAVKAKKRPLTTALVSEALQCLDQVSSWVDAFEARGVLPEQAGVHARDGALRLRAFLSNNEDMPDATANSSTPAWVKSLLEQVPASGSSAEALRAIAYVPMPGCFFNGDDPLALVARIPNLLALSIEPREPWPPLANWDPFTCNLCIHAVAAATREELAMIFRLVPDQVQIFELRPMTSHAVAEPADRKPGAMLEDVIGRQIAMLDSTGTADESYGRYGSAARAAANVLRHFARDDLGAEIERAFDAAVVQQSGTPVRNALREVASALATPEQVQHREADAPGTASRSLRIDEGRIASLFNLSGELIVTKNNLAHLSRLIQNVVGEGDLRRNILIAHENLERLVSEMHMAILQLRMVPVAQLFRSFPRVVRDISLRFGKKVELTTKGASTECDKHLVDRLFEPLLHIVRNAVDHGIESPEDRRAAGKPEQAHVTLEATRVGDRLIVEVRDDGRGINPAAIRAKALECGLLAADKIQALNDHEAIQLIFSAGLSTAAAVTEISGRGVGMDAVRNTVEQLGGRVVLASSFGIGTSVRLDLPVNIAMSHILIVAAGGQLFGLPMDRISETVSLTPDRVRHIKKNRGFVLRDRVVPICALAELLNLPMAQPTANEPRLVVVAEFEGKTVGLEVEAIHDRLDAVLKPMQGLLANVPAYAGTTILADGRVLLVLDLKEVFP